MNSLFGWHPLATVRENPIASGRSAWNLEYKEAYVWLNDHQMRDTEQNLLVAVFLNLGSAYPTTGQKSLTGEKDELASMTGGVWKAPPRGK